MIIDKKCIKKKMQQKIDNLIMISIKHLQIN